MASWIIALSDLAFARSYGELGRPGFDPASFLHIDESRIAGPAGAHPFAPPGGRWFLHPHRRMANKPETLWKMEV